LQVELKEYRKRLSWISSNGVSRSQSSSVSQSRNSIGGPNDFQFEFPKFGDLPAMSATNIFNGQKPQGTNTARSSTLPTQTHGTANRTNGATRSNSQGQTQRQASQSQSPSYTASPQQQNMSSSVDSLSGLFSPSILEASRHASLGGYFPNSMKTIQQRGSMDNPNGSGIFSNSSISNTDSPGSSSESHNAISSIGTSPEPSLNSPGNKFQELGLNTINEENNPYGLGKDKLCHEISRACGCAEDPIPPILNPSNGVDLAGYGNTNGLSSGNEINWMAQQNGTAFDPVLFGDYRENQDNVLSQDFGTFFNDAYPLPDLGSPLHNYTEVAPEAAKVDLIRQVDAAKEGEEVVPANDNPMTCNKIWYVLTDIFN
jgi:AP-1-like transcription factor